MTTEDPVVGTTEAPQKTPRQDFSVQEALTENLAALPASERASLGFSMNDLILDCQYAGSSCDPRYTISMFVIHYYYNTNYNTNMKY